MADEEKKEQKPLGDNQEEEIIVEEADASVDDEIKKQKEEELAQQKRKKRQFVIIVSSLGGLILLLVSILLVVILSEDKSQFQEFDTQPIVDSLTQDRAQLQSRLEDMISKANILYEEGRKQEALNLYEHIANFSKSISYYNLGVSQMKQEQYKEAIESFDQAILNQEHRTISALNAAVSAHYLNDKTLFEYYIDLAYAYLSYESSSPLYSYLYAAINFYKNNMFEVIAVANSKRAPYYSSDFSKLSAYAYLEYGSFYEAISELERTDDIKDEFKLGLAYANVAEYGIAANHLQAAVDGGVYPMHAPLALALVELKNYDYLKAAERIGKLRENYSDEVLAEVYPIEVKLSESLYDANKFQKEFVGSFKNNRRFAFELLFNYAPYKVFDAAQTIRYIQKGSGTIFIDEVSANTTTYLSRGGVISEVNIELSKAIRLALDKKITQANKMLKGLLEEYQNHSIVHYNLGLTYAQMNNFIKANEHFTRSYHLDASNYLAGIFAVMSAEIIKKDVEKLKTIVIEDLRLEAQSEEVEFYEALIEFINGNITAMISWSESEPRRTPLNVAFQVVTYLNFDNQNELIKYTNRLQRVTDRDLMSQMLHLYAQNYKEPIKQFAARVQSYFINNIMTINEIFHGAKLPMRTYIDFSNLAGELFSLKEQLNEAMLFSDDPRGIMYALAKVLILLQEHEHAYTIMNELIDKYEMKDSATLFLGAVTSIGAGHNANAVVLLRLASMEDANNYESRFGLGLLYHERKNIEGAMIQYMNTHGTGLRPKYFDFEVTDKDIVRGGA